MDGSESDPLDYGDRPDEYEDRVFKSPLRTHGVWPTVRRLLPDVTGKTVLDAACGPGLTAARLADAGAEVVGVDGSRGMVKYAADRYGDRATFVEADLTDPLPFDDGRFDVVVSQFTLEFVPDLHDTVGEFGRVLAPGGTLVVSLNHPVFEHLMTRYDELPDFESLIGVDCQPTVTTENGTQYFETTPYRYRWDADANKRPRNVTFHARPLGDVTGALLDSGFAITGLVEIGETPELADRRPDIADLVRDQPLMYLCLRGRL
jgi:ubiquinone/menaquinone biosynthesis C-methylase UbiE